MKLSDIYSTVSPRIRDGMHDAVIDTVSFGFSRRMYPCFLIGIMITQGDAAGERCEKRIWLSSKVAIDRAMNDFKSLGLFEESRPRSLEDMVNEMTGQYLKVIINTRKSSMGKTIRNVLFPRKKKADPEKSS